MSLAPLPVAPCHFALDPARVPTLAALYEERALRTPQATACRWFDAASDSWEACSWAGLRQRAARYATALQAEQLIAGDRVALRLPNGPDWMAIDWACQHLGLVTVGLYCEDTPASSAWMLQDSGARLGFFGDAAIWEEIRATHSLPQLQTAVALRGGGAPESRTRQLADWLPETAAMPDDYSEADALSTIVYTSGATGRPKGVMLSQSNVIANVFGCLRAIPLSDEDLRLSMLPMAHMFERTAGTYVSVAVGASTAFIRSLQLLSEDIRLHRPTVMVAVPRVFERVHAALLADLQCAPAPKRALFKLAVEAGWMALQNETSPSRRRLLPLALTRRVGQQIRDRLGGRLRFCVSGGAALSPDIARTFIALGLPILQGYGLTEAGPVVATNRPDDNDPSSVGVPLDNVQIRVSPDGELMVRGPSVMMGYWQDRSATAQAIDDAGWLRTGDKVSRLDTSRIFLTGRIKELIVLATGEKASPSEIEQVLKRCPVIDQIMVIGEARAYLGALVVAEPTRLAQLRTCLGLPDDSAEATREGLEKAILAQIRELQRNAPKNHLIRRVCLVSPPWSVLNGLMTASQKMRRAAIARHHAEDIERLYSGHFNAPKTDCSCNAGV